MTDSYAYEDRQQAAYAEAVRTTIGMVAATRRGDVQDAGVLLSSYHLAADNIGLTPCGSWAVLFSSAMHWVNQALRVIENETQIDPDELVKNFGAKAALWVSDTRGRGGY